ncbi:MAG: Rrf2 family transcriptional regulator [Acidimicrobiales bacterium]
MAKELNGFIATVLGTPPGQVTQPVLAELHDVPPAYLTKQLQRLRTAGIVESQPGRAGGYRLARPTADITVLDVVLATEGPERAFRCTEIRQKGPSAWHRIGTPSVWHRRRHGTLEDVDVSSPARCR